MYDSRLLLEQNDNLRGHFVDGTIHLFPVHDDHASAFLVGFGHGHHHPDKMLDMLANACGSVRESLGTVSVR